MSNQTVIYRLAVGLFNESRVLASAIADLAAAGLSAGNLCLVGLTRVFEGEPGIEAGNREAALLGSLVKDAETCTGREGSKLSVGTSSPVLQDLCKVPLSGSGRSWLGASQSERVWGHVAAGGLMLVVSSQTPEQQDASSRILLKHSKHAVTTHDFTARGAAGNGNSGQSRPPIGAK